MQERNSHSVVVCRGLVLLLLVGVLLRGMVIPVRAGAQQQPERVGMEVLLPDDSDPDGLRRALAASLGFLEKKKAAIPACWQPVLTPDRLRHTVRQLTELLAAQPGFLELRKKLARDYELYRLPGRLLVTGYFEPELRGSSRPDSRYRYPLYGPPDNLIVSRGRVWRRQGRELYTYWTRRQIETGGLAAGHELVWVDDPVDAFLLQIQGSGRIRFADGTVRRIQYAGNNGRPYRSIGRLLVEEGAMPLEEVSMPLIRQYLQDHPEERQRILYHNDRYVFFRWNDTAPAGQGPLGSIGQPLVAGRSVAMDPAFYPSGAVGFLKSRQPRFTSRGMRWVSLHRFVTVQDTGGAIRGPGRLDLFFGHGSHAGRAAGVMRVEGDFYVLIYKGTEE